MAKPMACSEFIRRAKLVHGDMYDYSQTVYVNMKHKVTIVCKIHGPFKQLPQPHLKGQGCPVCGREKQKQALLDKYGVDNPMKNKVIYNKARQTCLVKYGHEWAMSNESIRNKMVFTNRERYGVDYPLQSSDIKDQVRATIQRNYGVDFIGQSLEIREKAQQTCLERYGAKEPLASDIVRMKIMVTNCERYGGSAPMMSSEIRDKAKATTLLRYGVCHPSQSVDIVHKISETKRLNGTFGSSASEERLYALLCSVFGDDYVVRQYVSDKYPFACDFYIRSRDLYIELNGSWTHGHHWFDCNDKDDLATLDIWSNRGTKYYKNAIHVWTESDVNKRRAARDAHLNYVVFWDHKLGDAKCWFDMGCPDGLDWEMMYSWLNA